MIPAHRYTVSGSWLLDILFLYSIILDSINGLLSVNYHMETPVGKVFRLGVLVFLLNKILKTRINYTFIPWRLSFFPIIVGLLYLLSFIFWETHLSVFDIGGEFSGWVSYIYRTAIVVYMYIQVHKFDRNRILKLVYVTFVLLGGLNIIAGVSGLGLSTYKLLGIGVKAFYQDGNAFSMYMVMLLPLAIVYSIKCRTIVGIIGLVIGIMGTLLISTRASIIGVSVVLIIAFVCAIGGIIKDYYLNRKSRFLLLASLLLSLVIGYYFVNITFSNTSQVYWERFTVQSLSSSRTFLIDRGQEYINTYNNMEWYLGQGGSAATKGLAQQMRILQDKKSIESDFWDSILAYGWLLGGLIFGSMLLYYSFLVEHLLKGRFYLIPTMVSLGATLWILLSFFSGHASYTNTLISPLLGIYFYVIHFCKIKSARL